MTPTQIAEYQRDGYLILRGFLNQQEVSKLHRIATEDDTLSKHSYDVTDQAGRKSKLALWYAPGDDAYGLLTRSRRMVDAANALAEGEAPICHFHSKLMQKEPNVGGAWEWHQDYGYWYRNEFLLPEQMVSIMVAVTEANKANGCLQVIKGSHKMGRVEHGKAGEQVGAAQHYVDLALKTMELVYVELQPGDALVFHSNLLHRSEANLSAASRWSLISCYNRQSNRPYNERSTSCITPLDVVPDSALLERESAGLLDSAGFLNKQTDVSLQ